jgi:hypothetical protein
MLGCQNASPDFRPNKKPIISSPTPHISTSASRTKRYPVQSRTASPLAPISSQSVHSARSLATSSAMAASASPSPAISASTWSMSSICAALPTLRPSRAGRLRSSFSPAAAVTAVSVGCLGSFSGLAPVSNLLSLGAGK